MQDLSPRFEWQLGNLSALAHHIQKANLIFKVSLNNYGPVWEELDAAVKAHNMAHKLYFGSPGNGAKTSIDNVWDPTTLTWHLLGPKNICSTKGQAAHVWIVNPILGFDFELVLLNEV